MKITGTIFTFLFFYLIFVGAASAQDKSGANGIGSNKNEKQEYDRNIEIKKKPRVGTARFCSQSSGIVTLRVTFDKSEKITDVETISSSGCGDFEKNAVKAARRIKFKAAVKDGQPVTITKQVHYTFTIY